METYIREKPKLETGRKYKIELYPSKRIVEANYLGNDEGVHFFKTEDMTLRKYVMMKNRWLIKKDDILSYTPISSFSSVSFFTESDLIRVPSIKKCLENLGEKF